MWKKLVSLMVVGIPFFSTVHAQLTLVLQVPPVGVMQKAQLWNMALIYAGGTTSGVSIKLTLLRAKDNQPVLTAVSRPVFLTKGTTVVTPKDVSPVQYNYLSPVFTDRDPNGFLPVGDYKACYSVTAGGHSSGLLAEECIPVEVLPLSPPQLNSPTDTATVETAYPQFSWLPPAPVNLFSNLTYDMVLVEVLPGQGANEAIQKNIPVYTISHYKDQVHLYPASNRPLDTSRLYALRIMARNEDDFIDQSEVWTFKLAKPKPVIITPVFSNYIPLRKGNEPAAGIHRITTDTLGIKYYSFEKDHDATVSFYSTDGQLIRSVQQKIVYGDNFIAFKVSGYFQKDKLYRVEIIDGQKFKHTAGFSIQ